MVHSKREVTIFMQIFFYWTKWCEKHFKTINSTQFYTTLHLTIYYQVFTFELLFESLKSSYSTLLTLHRRLCTADCTILTLHFWLYTFDSTLLNLHFCLNFCSQFLDTVILFENLYSLIPTRTLKMHNHPRTVLMFDKSIIIKKPHTRINQQQELWLWGKNEEKY